MTTTRVGMTTVDLIQTSMMMWKIFRFELDNENLKRVTGLKKLVWEKGTNSEEESEDEVVEYDDDAVGTGNKGGDIVSEEKEEVDERGKSARRK